MNFCCSIVKFFVVLMNLVFWIAGIGIVALAVWMLVDPAFMISLAQEHQNYQYALFILLAIGILMVLLAFCGCCGALKESSCMLVSFFCCMLIVLTAEIAAGFWAYQNSDKLEAFVKSNFKHTIANEYREVHARTEMVDHIQIHLQCCGVDGPADWANTKYNNAKGGLLDLSVTNKLSYSVPPSCCKNGTERSLCETTRKGAITTSVNPIINKTGCMERVVQEVKRNIQYILLGGLIVIAVQLFGILLVLCLCCAVKRNKDDDYKD
ncbi:unnamed protein product [Chironomus riparius]|uniref:Tetraspanin n=1 Tax=Chironomus riparius TaxID=315576 RepID=A0A9N9WWX5_9DIPT|nr:unnamed protein product [Chironomus riparius]